MTTAIIFAVITVVIGGLIGAWVQRSRDRDDRVMAFIHAMVAYDQGYAAGVEAAIGPARHALGEPCIGACGCQTPMRPVGAIGPCKTCGHDLWRPGGWASAAIRRLSDDELRRSRLNLHERSSGDE